jgi:hypothetical protein
VIGASNFRGFDVSRHDAEIFAFSSHSNWLSKAEVGSVLPAYCIGNIATLRPLSIVLRRRGATAMDKDGLKMTL